LATRDRIFVSEIACLASIGVTAEERATPQPLSVDVDLEHDLRMAGASDAMADSIDYGRIVARVVELAGEQEYHLLERLATRVAEAVLEELGGAAVRVLVRKLEPPIPTSVGFVSVEVFRERVEREATDAAGGR
jgi:dihydroneopterin aldolase